jgi:hypothetical protein
MFNKNNGQWSAPPPNYLPIMNGVLELDDNKTGCVLDSNNNKGDNNDDGGNSRNHNFIMTSGGSNLETYINMSSDDDDTGDDDRWGKVYSLDQFRAKYC